MINVRYEKLQPKSISKLITKLLKQFKIPDKMAPNLNRKRLYGLINFLVHRKFVERNLGKIAKQISKLFHDNIIFGIRG